MLYTFWFSLPITAAGKGHDAHMADEEAEAQEGLFAWTLMPGCLTPKQLLLTPVSDKLLPHTVASVTAFKCVPREISSAP